MQDDRRLFALSEDNVERLRTLLDADDMDDDVIAARLREPVKADALENAAVVCTEDTDFMRLDTGGAIGDSVIHVDYPDESDTAALETCNVVDPYGRPARAELLPANGAGRSISSAELAQALHGRYQDQADVARDVRERLAQDNRLADARNDLTALAWDVDNILGYMYHAPDFAAYFVTEEFGDLEDEATTLIDRCMMLNERLAHEDADAESPGGFPKIDPRFGPNAKAEIDAADLALWRHNPREVARFVELAAAMADHCMVDGVDGGEVPEEVIDRLRGATRAAYDVVAEIDRVNAEPARGPGAA